MKKEISYKECIGNVENQLTHGGAFLVTADGERVNAMTIGWGGINYYWNETFVPKAQRKDVYVYLFLSKILPFFYPFKC